MKKILNILLMLMACTGASAQSSNAYRLAMLDQQFSNAYAGMNINEYYYYVAHPNWYVTTLLPTNDAMAAFVDPVSTGLQNPQVWSITSGPRYNQMTATVYNSEPNEQGVPTATSQLATVNSADYVNNRLRFLFDNSVIMGEVVPERKYYKTRGNTFLHIEMDGGTYKLHNPMLPEPLTLKPYEVDNGLVLATDGPLVPVGKNVAQCLAEHPEFSEFLELLLSCGALVSSAVDNTYGNLSILNAYHYTIYAPTNEAMREAYARGLPSPSDIDAAWEQGATGLADRLKSDMLNFVKYHIQADAVFIDNGFESGRYASSKFRLTDNVSLTVNAASGTTSVGAPHWLNVRVSPEGLAVTDEEGNTRHVVSDARLRNIMACEYWAWGGNSQRPYQNPLDSYSFAVIHAIDGPLYYSKTQGATR